MPSTQASKRKGGHSGQGGKEKKGARTSRPAASPASEGSSGLGEELLHLAGRATRKSPRLANRTGAPAQPSRPASSPSLSRQRPLGKKTAKRAVTFADEAGVQQAGTGDTAAQRAQRAEEADERPPQLGRQSRHPTAPWQHGWQYITESQYPKALRLNAEGKFPLSCSPSVQY